MTKYRIVEVMYDNKEVCYIIQKQSRLFWIGPKIWKSYQGNNYYESPSWSIFKKHACVFKSLQNAINKIKNMQYRDGYNKATYKSIAIYDTY